jgi:hypothetical protein
MGGKVPDNWLVTVLHGAARANAGGERWMWGNKDLRCPIANISLLHSSRPNKSGG